MYWLIIRIIVIATTVYFIYSRSDPQSNTITPISIDRLLKEPAQFDGKDVSVAGVVSQSAGIMGYGGFLLRHDSHPAEILVVTSGGIPSLGDKIVVFGRFHQAFTLNSRQYAAIVRSH